MKRMLPLQHLTTQDKRVLYLYFAIALLSAACLAFGLLFAADFQLGKKANVAPLPTKPAPTPTP